ncbi:Replication protein 1a [Eumeta japonica]|uniref:Replication protein 1a n=1 Tax=Eumeta variegata TaxID=151549 RepID=A0A4C1Z7R4_EUMVA|nr:Replication protein 1a [Eumeta japonica]
MASILVNGFKEHTHNRLLIDEAMMNHFGAIITAALLAKAKELLLIGDINQIPHIDRHNVFPMSYEKPNAVAKSPENCYDLTETHGCGICPQRNL